MKDVISDEEVSFMNDNWKLMLLCSMFYDLCTVKCIYYVWSGGRRNMILVCTW